MKRLLLLFLLVVLPLQMSLAAASDYCQHESGRSAHHFGHHEHHHQAEEGKVTKSKLGTSDNDCGCCHHASANIFATLDGEAPFVKSTTLVAYETRPYLSHLPDRPTKPNWQLPI